MQYNIILHFSPYKNKIVKYKVFLPINNFKKAYIIFILYVHCNLHQPIQQVPTSAFLSMYLELKLKSFSIERL